jgi:alkylation response protein AidB-like acyl-CoA dehydrogenase
VPALHALHRASPADVPRLVPWDAWGHRIDAIELTPLWKEAAKVAAEHGLVATAYEKKSGPFSRVHQFALAYLFEPATAVFTCPLAMTDGAAKTLLGSGERSIAERAVPRLTSRDPAKMWTSGQWMTERTGGSDVGISESVARPEADGTYRLYGTKWFSSATTSDMALTLARPQGNPPGGSGLALFYLETRLADGTRNGILVNRLKDKLGTRMVPTAELTLDGAQAHLIGDPSGGVKRIAPMLTITRLWNAIGACGGMRYGIALARDYAKRRVAFGAPLAEKPLHVDTLAAVEAEYQGAFLLTFFAIELLGREETGSLSERDAQVLRLVVPLTKLTTAKQAVAAASEVLEAFGGAGYVEDTGLPRLLRDAQVLPIWEGTTNVLALDALRALSRSGGPLEALEATIHERTADAHPTLARAAKNARAAVAHASTWLESAAATGIPAVEAGARRFALTLGRATELALLVEHGTWDLAHGGGRSAAAARRFAAHGVDLLESEVDSADARRLAGNDV